jgi:hypothetical protein
MDYNKLEAGGGQQESGLFHVYGHNRYLFSITAVVSVKESFQLNFPSAGWMTFLLILALASLGQNQSTTYRISMTWFLKLRFASKR